MTGSLSCFHQILVSEQLQKDDKLAGRFFPVRRASKEENAELATAIVMLRDQDPVLVTRNSWRNSTFRKR